MKIAINFLRVIIALMIVFLLVELYVERDIARRAYEYSKEDYITGEYLNKFKTIAELNENRINSYEYRYGVFKFLFIWNTSIVFLVLLLLFLQWKVKSITTKEK